MAVIHDRHNGITVDQSAAHDHTKTVSNYCPACVAKGVARSNANPPREETGLEAALREKREDDRREWYE